MADRVLGTLVRWNADRGFGFIAPDGGGVDVFVHASDMARIGGAPQVGWRLDFQLRPGKDGRPRAVDVQREGLRLALAPHELPRNAQRDAPRPTPARAARPPLPATHGRRGRSPLVLVAILVLGTAGYLLQRASSNSPAPLAPMTLASPEQAEPTSFTCDGRTHCSQMNSCEEATWFVQHCPNTEMDGDGDGIPCEQQWCN